MTREFRWTLGRLRPVLLIYLASATLGIVLGLAGLGEAALVKLLVDHALPEGNSRRTLQCISILLVISLARPLLGVLSSHISLRANLRFTLAIRLLLLKRLTTLASLYHQRTKISENVFRVERDVEQVADFAGALLLQSGTLISSFITIAVGIVWTHASLLWIIVPANATLLLLRLSRSVALVNASEEVRRSSIEASSTILDHVTWIPELQLLNAERLHLRRVGSVLSQKVRAELSRRNLEVLTSSLSGIIVTVAGTVVLAIGSWQVLEGVGTIGSAIAAWTLTLRMFDPMNVLWDLHGKLARARSSVRGILAVAGDATRLPEPARPTPLGPTVTGKVTLANVSFGYGDRAVLENINLTFQPGEPVGIMGESGSGKTTLGKLLARVFDPTIGQVCLDDIDLRNISRRDLRKLVAYVPQEPVIFRTTVRNNLLIGNESVADAALEECLHHARLDEVIRRLPLGLETVLEGNGSMLSGGERQRIALARNLLRSPMVLVLDESTSALDLFTETSVFRYIESTFRLRTLIIISHRLSSIPWLHQRVKLVRGGGFQSIESDV
jgi:ATP-binding cassette subfamily B protein